MPAHRRLAPVLVFMAIALFGARPADAMDFFARTARTCLPAEISNLPIVAVEPSPAVSADRFVIWISGDGGWSSLERDITQTTAQQGVPTAALNTLLYFARKRSAQQTAREIERMAQAFSRRWGRSRFVLVGYSFGADIGPSAAAALSADVRAQMDAAIFLSPSQRVFHRVGPASWLGVGGAEPVAQALGALGDLRVVCVRGVRDERSACPIGGGQGVETIDLPAGHTLHGAALDIAAIILRAADGNTAAAR